MVFQITTLEGWTAVQSGIQMTFSNWMALYFIIMVLIGSFFLINLTLAIIKSKFSEAQEKNHNMDPKEVEKK